MMATTCTRIRGSTDPANGFSRCTGDRDREPLLWVGYLAWQRRSRALPCPDKQVEQRERVPSDAEHAGRECRCSTGSPGHGCSRNVLSDAKRSSSVCAVSASVFGRTSGTVQVAGERRCRSRSRRRQVRDARTAPLRPRPGSPSLLGHGSALGGLAERSDATLRAADRTRGTSARRRRSSSDSRTHRRRRPCSRRRRDSAARASSASTPNAPQ